MLLFRMGGARMVRLDSAVTVCGGFLETGKWNSRENTHGGTYRSYLEAMRQSVEQYQTFLI